MTASAPRSSTSRSRRAGANGRLGWSRATPRSSRLRRPWSRTRAAAVRDDPAGQGAWRPGARPARGDVSPARKGPASQVVQARLLKQVARAPPHDLLYAATPRTPSQDAGRHTPPAQRTRDVSPTLRPRADRTDSRRAQVAGGRTGEPRDAEVMRERLEEKLADEPPEAIRGAGYQRMDQEMRAEYVRARERMLEALRSDRYFALLDRLDDLAADPPWSEKAAKPVDSVLRKRVDTTTRDWSSGSSSPTKPRIRTSANIGYTMPGRPPSGSVTPPNP